MPGIFFTPASRRDFLKTTISTSGLFAITGCAATRRHHIASSPVEIALLSDIHVPADRNNIYRGFKPWDNLNRIVPEVIASRPEGVIICGDVARLEGFKTDYDQVETLLALVAGKTPIYMALGNHDDRTNFNAVFKQNSSLQQNVPDKHVLLIEYSEFNIIILDSLLFVNKVPGLLGHAQREWLGKYLVANKQKSVVLFVHHTLEDNDGDLQDTPRLFELLRPHQQVKAIFYGHSHVWEIKEREGIKLVNLPAVGYNFRDQDPVGWVSARFSNSGVDLKLHAFAGNTADDGKNFRIDWHA
jgi:3',5'-cyclic-AMP phosphodiesterase